MRQIGLGTCCLYYWIVRRVGNRKVLVMESARSAVHSSDLNGTGKAKVPTRYYKANFN